MKRPSFLKTLLLVSFLFTAVSCGNSTNDDSERQGGDTAHLVGIQLKLCEMGEEEKLKGLPQYNFGDCTGKEEFVPLYRVAVNTPYYLLIDPVLSGGSKIFVFSGDVAKIEENDAYTVNFYEEYKLTAYKLIFNASGTYRVKVTVESFAESFDAEVA